MRPYLKKKKNYHKKGLVVWFKVKATPKKKKKEGGRERERESKQK
jgi:hypothetical protein